MMNTSLRSAAVTATWLGLILYRHVPYRSELWWQFALHGDAPRFLRATVAPHQRDFRFLSDELLERWVQELGLRSGRMAEWQTDEIVHDGALWPAVNRPCSELKYPGMSDQYREPIVSPTKEQNILAGRYLRTLAYVGRLIGPDRMSPEEIAAAWQGKNRTDSLSRPSFLTQVAELLAIAPELFLPPTET